VGKPGLDGSDQTETARCIEARCMRIADDMQNARRTTAGDVSAVVDESPSDAALPEMWLDKQRIQLCSSIFSRDDGGEPDDDAVELCDEHVPGLDLFEWHLDRVGVREQRIAIH